MCKKEEFTEKVMELVCNEFGVKEQDLASTLRTSSEVKARYAFVVLLRKHSFLTQREIAARLRFKLENGVITVANKEHEVLMSNLQYRACYNSVLSQLKEIYK